MLPNDSIYVAGHSGLVGSSLVRALKRHGFSNILTTPKAETNLTRRAEVNYFFRQHEPKYVFLAAARVGGIEANQSLPAEFIYENLTIQTNVIDAAYEFGVQKLLFLGSSCIYPKHADQPIKESSLLTGPLEPTNEAYAIAKIAGIKMVQAYRKQYGCNFISAMPTNLYGPGDNYHPKHSHVLPALLVKMHAAKMDNAKSVTCWGTGQARREFLHSDDLAEALIVLMHEYNHLEDPINIGYGTDQTIADLVDLVKDVVGYEGQVNWDTSKPDGTPRKLLDSSKIAALGWRPKIKLRHGLEMVYKSDFLDQMPKV